MVPRPQETKQITAIRMKGEELEKKSISESEWILLETLDCRPNRPLHTGPFLTVQRRRRRRKYVRTYLFKDPTLIDDLSAHQTNFVLDRISNWEFNAFILDNVTGGRPLPNLCVHLFKMYGLLEHFNLDPVTVWKVFSIIEDGYHWRNPYHNAVHAADVTQAMHCFLQENFILEKLTPVEILSALIAAVTHDLDHPGVNQPFLVATSNHLAALYKNSSVLENHHWRSAMGCLHESGMSSVLGPDLVQDVEWQIRSLVLATDITRQREFLEKLRDYLDTDTLDMDSPDVRHFVLQIALKCADICNPCRPWDISKKWSMKVCEEFFRQGDYEKKLNLPVTSLCDRDSTSVPKIQTGFLDYVVEPLFKEWHRMLHTPLSTNMRGNLVLNKAKWQQLLVEEEAEETQTETSDADEAEIAQRSTGEAETISLREALVTAKQARREERLAAAGQSGSRSVRFEIGTTVTAASDSENSEEDEGEGIDRLRSQEESDDIIEREFLGIPRPDGRRHSIATGLMGIQVPSAQILNTLGGLGSGMSSSTLNMSDVVASSRTVGRTVIRRESLPSGNLLPGRALPSKTILHLQRLSAKVASEQSSSSSTAPRADSTSPPELPVSPGRIMHEGKSSCSSTSTVDEILDFTYSLPETGSRSSGSPRRSTLEATDLDELCPSTSILSMSPSVAHVTLQQSIEGDEQRRHLIRQQTCPVVSVHTAEGGGNFNRPRFLSAAAAISPTTVAQCNIISQHRYKNRSPETGEEGASGRLSGGSSNEGLMQACEVISEEVDRLSSTEASPLEIFVQQFPPVPDDNDGEPPRRGSGSCNLDSEQNDPSNFDQSNNLYDSSYEPCNYSSETPNEAYNLTIRSRDSLIFTDDDDCDEDEEGEGYDEKFEGDFERNNLSGRNHEEEGAYYNACEDDQGGKRDEANYDETDIANTSRRIVASSSTSSKLSEKPSTSATYDSSTQTDCLGEKENFDPSGTVSVEDESPSFLSSSTPGSGITHTGCNTVSTSTATGNNRLATLLMWRNNRVWKSLTEEGPEENSCSEMDLEEHLPQLCERWDVRFSQQTHQGVVGARLQIRRGSAPTTGPTLGCRGAQDRRSDPTQYHSCCYENINLNSTMGTSMPAQLRRGSVPVDLLRQTMLRPMPQVKKSSPSKTGRRGSLPTDAANPETSSGYKWMQVFPYSEDDTIVSMKRRSSGGPELFAAAQTKSFTSWKPPMLIEQIGSCGIAAESSGVYWPGRRRGSLPVEVCMASSGSCSSESESSAGDSSDT